MVSKMGVMDSLGYARSLLLIRVHQLAVTMGPWACYPFPVFSVNFSRTRISGNNGVMGLSCIDRDAEFIKVVQG